MSYELHFGVTFQTEGVNCRLQDTDYMMRVAGCRYRLPINTEALCI